MIKKILVLLILSFLNTNAQIEELDTLHFNKEDLLENNFEEESSIEELFIRTGEKLFSKPNIEIRSRFKKQLQRSRGYDENVYLGSPLYSYQRIRIGNKAIESGILFKKDAGEKSYNDFFNYYIRFDDLLGVKKIIFGDYIIESGQGLMFWRSYYYAKGVSFSQTTIRKGKELQSYNSSDELGFMRGIATELDLKFLQIIGFYSKRKLSATIDTSGAIKNFYFTYFRTQSDLVKRNNTNENIYGLRILKCSGNANYGVTFSRYIYSRPVKKFQKNSFPNLGIDFLLRYDLINLTSESYLNDMKYLNSFIAVKFLPLKSISCLFSYRNYAPSTFNRFSNPFGEYSGGNNEKGFFIGLNWKILKNLLLIAYKDTYEIPFSEAYSFKKVGSEYFLQLGSSIFKKIDIYFRYHNKNFEDKIKSLDEFNRLIKMNEIFSKENFRFNLDYEISTSIHYRFRFEYLMLNVKYTQMKECGRIFYHDVALNILPKTLLNFRVTFFSTASYQSGISVYENDFDGVFSNPVLYGKGLKWYFMFKYIIKELLSISLKYSYLIREDVKKIGTGWDQLPTNFDNRIGIQLDINL